MPNHTPWLFLWSIAALLIGLLAQFAAAERRSALALVATSAVRRRWRRRWSCFICSMSRESNGARINVVQALDLREFSDGAAPDDSRLYSRPPGEDLWLDIYRPRRATAPASSAR